MKKTVTVAMVTVATAAMLWFAQPVQPHHYKLHRVTYGETLESIVKDSNRNTSIDYDIRNAVATAVTESAKMEGGATSRSIKPGEKVAVPIYR